MKHANPIDFKSENFRDYGDPYVLRHNGTYYLYFTSANPEGYPIVYSSSDLLHWKNEGEVTKDEKALCAFAPEVIYAFGKFYMVTSPKGKGHYVFISSSPTGPFERATENIGSMIDGSLFVSKDNSLHFLRASFSGIVLLDMDKNGDIFNHRVISSSLDGWTEGPSLLNIEDKYYLFYCGNHYCASGYRVNYAVSDALDGPYIDGINNPLIIDTESPISKLGHSSEVLSPDLCSFLCFYHGMENKPGKSKRVVNFDRLFINKGDVSVTPSFFETEKYRNPTFSTIVSSEETEFVASEKAKEEFVLEAFMDEKTTLTFGNDYSFSISKNEFHIRKGNGILATLPNFFDFSYPHTIRLENKDKLYLYVDTANIGSFEKLHPSFLGFRKEKGNHLSSFAYSYIEDMEFPKSIPGFFGEKLFEDTNNEIKFNYVAEKKDKYELSLLLKWKRETKITINEKEHLLHPNESEFSSLFVSFGLLELEKEGTLYIKFNKKEVEIKGIKLEKAKTYEPYLTPVKEEEQDVYCLNENEGSNEVEFTFVNHHFAPYSEAGVLLNVNSFSEDNIQCRYHFNGLFIGFRNRLLVIEDVRYKKRRIFDKPSPIEEGREYHLKVVYKDSSVFVYLDGALLANTYYPSLNTFGRDGYYISAYSKVEIKDYKSRRSV